MSTSTNGTSSTSNLPDTSGLEAAMAANQAFQLKIAILQQHDQAKQALNHAMQQSAQNIR
jgi:hypothetical protein